MASDTLGQTLTLCWAEELVRQVINYRFTGQPRSPVVINNDHLIEFLQAEPTQTAKPYLSMCHSSVLPEGESPLSCFVQPFSNNFQQSQKYVTCDLHIHWMGAFSVAAVEFVEWWCYYCNMFAAKSYNETTLWKCLFIAACCTERKKVKWMKLWFEGLQALCGSRQVVKCQKVPQL